MGVYYYCAVVNKSFSFVYTSQGSLRENILYKLVDNSGPNLD